MAIIRRTKFSDGYLLEKVRAITFLARDPYAACTRVVNLLHESFPHYTWSGLYLRRDKHLELVFYRGSMLSAPDPVEPLENSLLGWAIRTRRTQILPDATQDPRYARIEIPVKSEMLVPLKWRNRSVALLDLCSDRPRGFDRLDLDLLGAIAAELSPLAAQLAGDPAALQAHGVG